MKCSKNDIETKTNQTKTTTTNKNPHLQKAQNILRHMAVKLQALCLAQRSAELVCVCLGSACWSVSAANRPNNEAGHFLAGSNSHGYDCKLIKVGKVRT